MATLNKGDNDDDDDDDVDVDDDDDDDDDNNNNKSATFDCYSSDLREFSYLGSHEFSFGKYRLFR